MRFWLTALAMLFFLPHLRAARAAAERVVAMARQFGNGAARIHQRIARCVVGIVVATKVARVMECDVTREALGLELARSE
jgi:hypothetical protein